MGDSPDRITSAPTVQNNTTSDTEDVFLPSKSHSHNSHSRHSPTQRKSLGETSNGFEGWPQAVETRRPSTLINSSYMPRLTENVEEEVSEMVPDDESIELNLLLLAENASPARSRSTVTKPLSPADKTESVPPIKPRAFNSNGTVVRDPSKTNRLSDENSVTLLDAGALHLPPYSEEEEDEKVEQLGLHLNETADRLNEEYKSTPPITMEKPFSLQVLVSAGDVNPGQSKSDSGLGSSASKPGKSITKHSEEVSEVAAPDGKKTRPERRQTISEYLREAGGSQLNGDVLDAIKTLQAIASEADSVGSIEEPSTQLVTDYIYWLLEKVKQYQQKSQTQDKTDDLSTSNQVTLMSDTTDIDQLKVAEYVDCVIRESISQLEEGGSLDNSRPTDRETGRISAISEKVPDEFAEEELVLPGDINDKQLSTSHLVTKLATEILYRDVERNNDGVHVHLHIYNKPENETTRYSQDVTSQTSPTPTGVFRVLSEKLDEKSKVISRQGRECLRRSRENLEQLKDYYQTHERELVPVEKWEGGCRQSCQVNPESAQKCVDVCSSFECRGSSCLVVPGPTRKQKMKVRRSIRERTSRHSSRLSECMSSCECLTPEEEDGKMFKRKDWSAANCAAPIQIYRPVINSPRKKSKRSKQSFAIQKYTSGIQRQTILWNILRTEYDEIYSQGRPLVDSLEFLKRCHPLTYTMSPLDRYVYIYIYNLRFDELYEERYGDVSVLSLASHYLVEPVLHLVKTFAYTPIKGTCSQHSGCEDAVPQYQSSNCGQQAYRKLAEQCIHDEHYPDQEYYNW